MTYSEIPELSIVIPCFREGEKILKDLKAATDFLTQENISGEVVVVDDGSSDNTAKTAESFSKQDSRVRVVRYEQNRGKGYALRQGVARSKGKYVMFADAGLCVPYSYCKIGLQLLRDQTCDMAIGSRALPESVIVRKSPWYRQIGSRLFWILLRMFMGIPKRIRDTQCGFKFYVGENGRQLFAECMIDGFMIDIELIYKALRQGWKIQNFPVEWSNDKDTRFRPLIGSWPLLWDLLRIRMCLKK